MENLKKTESSELRLTEQTVELLDLMNGAISTNCLKSLEELSQFTRYNLCPYTPILWRGDINSSKPKILTLGITPDVEEYDIKYQLNTRYYTGENLIASYNNYFNGLTSFRWFNGTDGKVIKMMVESLSASFDTKSQSEYQAIHTDVFPIPVSDISKLPKIVPFVFYEPWDKLLCIITTSSTLEVLQSQSALVMSIDKKSITLPSGAELIIEVAMMNKVVPIYAFNCDNTKPLDDSDLYNLISEVRKLIPIDKETLKEYITENTGLEVTEFVPNDPVNDVNAALYDLYIPSLKCLIQINDKSDAFKAREVIIPKPPYSSITLIVGKTSWFDRELEKVQARFTPFP